MGVHCITVIFSQRGFFLKKTTLMKLILSSSLFTLSHVHANIVSSIQDAFNFVTLTNATNHGCHCAGLASGGFMGGQPIDDLDRQCKVWKSARKCLTRGGTCDSYKQHELPSYSADLGSGCDHLDDPCEKALCEVDMAYSNNINAMTSTEITERVVTQCVVAGTSGEETDTSGIAALSSEAAKNKCCLSNSYFPFYYNDMTHRSTNGEITSFCELGNFFGGTDCNICPAGYYCEDGSEANICEAGTFATSGSSQCSVCPSGHTCSEGSETPEVCPSGTYAEEGSTSCTTCLAGFYCEEGSAAPEVCPAGYRCSNDGTGAPPICPSGTFAAEGSTSCTTCPPRRYSVAGAAECHECNIPTDIVVQLDGSGSLSAEFWNNQINFVKSFLDNFTLGQNDTRVSAIQYNSGVTREIDAFGLTSNSQINSRFNGINFQRIGCGTCSRIGYGYREAHRLFNHNGRSNAKKVLIALTDGYTPHDNEAALNQAMMDLRSKNVEIFFILIGSGSESGLLQGLSMYPNFINDPAKGWQTNNWNSLGAVQEAVENAICSA